MILMQYNFAWREKIKYVDVGVSYHVYVNLTIKLQPRDSLVNHLTAPNITFRANKMLGASIAV